MPSFRYQYGDRPLDGFTIQHGLGRGGFGEVYYAISDSGREVALKAVQQYEDIELRGIGHCMNLKSPHLVTIFDVKHSPRGEPFVIMEYVNGPSLREIMDEAPLGLGPAKAVFLLREIAKGLSYLHQSGVVHRDLKPHNVFIDQGVVKIGDYSLSKIMSASHRSGHTVTVGTVHYMAPEIGVGRYDHTVDIYALGVIFYEMLTGAPPFRGDSVGEVLIKHINGEPDLSHVAEPYASVIRKAMAKNPLDRYQSADQMVTAAMGNAQIHDSLAGISADDLTMIARRAAAQASPEVAPDHSRFAAYPAHDSERRRSSRPGGEGNAGEGRRATDFASGRPGFFSHMQQSCRAFSSAIGLSRRGWPDYWGPVRDPVGPLRRLFLALMAVAFFVTVPTVLSGGEEDVFFPLAIWIGGGTAAALLTKKLLLPIVETNASFVYRFMFGGVCATSLLVGSLIISEHARHHSDLSMAIGVFAAIPLCLLDWRVMSSPLRPSRFGLTPTIGAAMCAIFPPSAWVVAGIAVAVQLASKYDPAVSQRFGLNFPWYHHLLQALAALGPFRRRPPTPTAACGTSRNEPAAAGGPRHEPSIARDTWFHPAASSAAEARDRNRPSPHAPWHPLISKFARATVEANRRSADGVRWFAGELSDAWRTPLAERRGDEAGEGAAGPLPRGWRALRRVPVNHYSSILADSLTAVGNSLKRLVMTVVAFVALTIAWMIALGATVGVAQAVAAGATPVNPVEIQRFLGLHDWPLLVNSIALWAALVLAVPASGLLILARRDRGAAHMARACMGIAILAGSLLFFAAAFQRGEVWMPLGVYVRGGEPGLAIARLLDGQDGRPFVPPLALGMMASLAGALTLLWPVSRNRNHPWLSPAATPAPRHPAGAFSSPAQDHAASAVQRGAVDGTETGKSDPRSSDGTAGGVEADPAARSEVASSVTNNAQQ